MSVYDPRETYTMTIRTDIAETMVLGTMDDLSVGDRRRRRYHPRLVVGSISHIRRISAGATRVAEERQEARLRDEDNWRDD